MTFYPKTKRKLKTEYRTVDTHTLAGLKQAERLHRAGWKQTSVSLFTIQFSRRKP